jgi:photosystem I subunit 11
VAYGAGAGALAAVTAAVTRRSGRRVQRRAAKEAPEAPKGDIEVAEKPGAVSKLAYLDKVPNSILKKQFLTNMIACYDKKTLEDPPEDSLLYSLKLYAETYNTEGGATRMNWHDFFSVRLLMTEAEYFVPQFEEALKKKKEEQMLKGIVPMLVPGPTVGPVPGFGVIPASEGVFFPTGATFKWRGPEPFAGDQVRSLVTDGKFAKDFIKAMAFYRDGLKPWQRGIEIGMAHGYFIIGPFVSLGPLRNTPEAATVGLLSGAAVIFMVIMGGLGFGTVMKPTLFDEEGDKPGKGYTEMINWHLVGGLGGAGFAHALITIFGS